MPGDKRDSWSWQQSWEQLDQAERLSRTFFLRRAATARPVWEPPVDVFESETSVWVVVALPGVGPEGIELRIEAQHLVVAGDRSRPAACANLAVRRMEIPHGRFERRVDLPVGSYHMASRDMLDGCLVVRLDRV